MKHKKSIFLFIFAVLIAALVLSCDSDCPACPEEPPEISQRYLITYSRIPCLLVSIDVPSDTVIDTASLDFECGGAYLHPDNDKIMMLNVTDLVMEIYSIPDLDHLGSSSQYGAYYFDYQDQYGLCYSFTDNALYKINSETLLPVDTVGSMVINDEAYLDTLNDVFYAADLSDTGIYIIDCSNMKIRDTLYPDYHTFDVLYNPKYDELYYIGSTGSGISFQRLNLTTMEEQGETFLYTQLGSIAMSPDYEHVLVTHGGDGIHGVIPPPVIYHYIPAEEDLEVIPADPFAVLPSHGLPILGNMAFTPEGRRVYVASNYGYYGRVPVGVVDMVEGRMTHTIDMPDSNLQYNNVILTR